MDVVAFSDVGQLGEEGKKLFHFLEQHAHAKQRPFVLRWWRARMGCALVKAIGRIIEDYSSQHAKRVGDFDPHCFDDQVIVF